PSTAAPNWPKPWRVSARGEDPERVAPDVDCTDLPPCQRGKGTMRSMVKGAATRAGQAKALRTGRGPSGAPSTKLPPRFVRVRESLLSPAGRSLATNELWEISRAGGVVPRRAAVLSNRRPALAHPAGPSRRRRRPGDRSL